MSTNNGFGLKEGRTNKTQYINTKYSFIDLLNESANCETLGFYLSIKRYINRKNNTKDNQITYTQKYLENKFNIGHSKYYKHLKILFNIGLLDMEKKAKVKFFINYDIEGKSNPLVEKNILYFSTFENINLKLKRNIEKIIEEQNPEIPKELINIIEVQHETNYIVHDYPPIKIFEKNDFKFVPYREWDEEMNKFKRGKNKTNKKEEKKEQIEEQEEDKNDITPPFQNGKEGAFQNGKEGAFQNGKEGAFQNGKVNNIIESPNSIITLGNNTINPSSEEDIDRLIDLDKQIKNAGFKGYDELIYSMRLDKSYYNFPMSEWIGAVKRAVWEMYYYDDTVIRGKRVSRYDVVHKLQDLDIEMVESAINKVISMSKKQRIEYPVAFIKTVLFNEIDEFDARIQSMVDYDLNNDD